MSNNWNVVPFTEAVDICDIFRKPINSSERASRIKGKEQSELYPYYGATGQVGFIDDYIGRKNVKFDRETLSIQIN